MKRAIAPILLFVAAVAVYVANGRFVDTGDARPARYLPWSLLRELDFDLDEFPALYDEAARRDPPLLDGIPYYLRLREGHYLSAYTPAPALVVLPLYAVPILAGLPPTPFWAGVLEKGAAATVTALSVVFLYAAVARMAARRWALLVALVYAFGTSSLSVSSQALWQHGPSQCALALALYLLVRGLGDERRLPWAALAMAGAAVLRETNGLLLAPLGAVLLVQYRHLALRLVLFGLPPVMAMAAYYGLHFGAAGSGAGHESVPLLAYFRQTPLVEGLGGVLVSPGRGLFIYSPVLLFALPGLVMAWRRGPAPLRALALGLPLVILLVAKWFMWWGGTCFGPRLLAETTPVLCFFLYPLGEAWGRRRTLAVVFGIAATLSVAVHALGAFSYDGRWDGLAETDRNPARLWSWREGPMAFYAREALAAARQRVVTAIRTSPTSRSASQGSPPATAPVSVLEPRAPDLDRLLVTKPAAIRDAPSLTVVTDQAADRLRITVGLANPGRPRNFDAYMLVRGKDGRAWSFDGEQLSPAGPGPWPPWIRNLPLPAEVTGRFTLPVSALAGGRPSHFTWNVVLTESGQSRVIARAATTFTVEDALAPAARRAAGLIRAHQTASGSWPTAVTPGAAFQQPRSEMNVFVPALIVELLEPIAKETGLIDAVERARAWLAAQIEETGLVRYHGNPGPIANPGCELPPDADDTALVWRLAPRSEAALREAARAAIERYRVTSGTGTGLYRVWLAQEDIYRCFYKYSGRVLNPTDVAVQMHLYLFFARTDPEAARRLCDALRPRMADPRIWVYYEVAPFIPRLRETDLALAGCPLRVPEARLRHQPKAQEPYLDLAARRRAGVLPILTGLAADDFSAVERTPPLLYHNDLTATPPHYHWSVDVGYALWLRAYVDSAR